MLAHRPGMTLVKFTVAKTFFIIFVDAIFTTLLERLFTNALDLTAVKSASDCLCLARHAG
jgi:hypothetical protein